MWTSVYSSWWNPISVSFFLFHSVVPFHSIPCFHLFWCKYWNLILDALLWRKCLLFTCVKYMQSRSPSPMYFVLIFSLPRLSLPIYIFWILQFQAEDKCFESLNEKIHRDAQNKTKQKNPHWLPWSNWVMVNWETASAEGKTNTNINSPSILVVFRFALFIKA